MRSWSVYHWPQDRFNSATRTLLIVTLCIWYSKYITRARREWLGTGNAPSPGASLGLKNPLRAENTTVIWKMVHLVGGTHFQRGDPKEMQINTFYISYPATMTENKEVLPCLFYDAMWSISRLVNFRWFAPYWLSQSDGDTVPLRNVGDFTWPYGLILVVTTINALDPICLIERKINKP